MNVIRIYGILYWQGDVGKKYNLAGFMNITVSWNYIQNNSMWSIKQIIFKMNYM